MTTAHIAGLPIEESLATALPAASIAAVLIGAWLRTLATTLRNHKQDKPNR